MKSFYSLAALVAAACAQDYNITSPGFKLVLTTACGTVNQSVAACHVGAGFESLCLLNSTIPSSTFYFNTTSFAAPPVNRPDLGTPGILTWVLPVAGGTPQPSAAHFAYDPSTNLALPILQLGTPTNVQLMSFTDKNQLILQGTTDFTTNPPSQVGAYALSRWYVCTTEYAGYVYNNLAWGLGPVAPQNPSCASVNVTRVFV
ncbi:hypothetical protein ACEQ8H_006191 [Pleosporales sp. CAS-2024a]